MGLIVCNPGKLGNRGGDSEYSSLSDSGGLFFSYWFCLQANTNEVQLRVNHGPGRELAKLASQLLSYSCRSEEGKS